MISKKGLSIIKAIGGISVEILVAILVGAVSGWIAGEIMKTSGGLIKNIILGIVGSSADKEKL